jgi:uncharacterized protein DUF4357
VALPRTVYPATRSTRPEFRTPGVYLLAGPAQDPQREGRIYVGEGDDPRERLDAHHAGKDFWNRVVLFTSVNEGLNKATIRYLEARLLDMAVAAGRTEVDNGTAPALPPLSEADREDAESFLADMLVIYQLLGINSFEPLEEAAVESRLRLSGPEAEAEGSELEDGFMVFAGGRARAAAVESTPGWVRRIREDLVEADLLSAINGSGSLRLVANHKFSSPSAAAAVMLGRAANGTEEWRNQQGQSLKEIRTLSVPVSG